MKRLLKATILTLIELVELAVLASISIGLVYLAERLFGNAGMIVLGGLIFIGIIWISYREANEKAKTPKAELTQEDIERIHNIIIGTAVLDKQGNLRPREDYYAEVLQRFKEEKK